MAYCGHCNNLVGDNDKFCLHCGEKLEKVSLPKEPEVSQVSTKEPEDCLKDALAPQPIFSETPSLSMPVPKDPFLQAAQSMNTDDKVSGWKPRIDTSQNTTSNPVPNVLEIKHKATPEEVSAQLSLEPEKTKQTQMFPEALNLSETPKEPTGPVLDIGGSGDIADLSAVTKKEGVVPSWSSSGSGEDTKIAPSVISPTTSVLASSQMDISAVLASELEINNKQAEKEEAPIVDFRDKSSEKADTTEDKGPFVQSKQTGQSQQSSAIEDATVPNYLFFAILTTLCCCPFTGIVSVFYASTATSKANEGDFAEGMRLAKCSRNWIFASLGLFLILFIISIVGVILSSD